MLSHSNDTAKDADAEMFLFQSSSSNSAQNKEDQDEDGHDEDSGSLPLHSNTLAASASSASASAPTTILVHLYNTCTAAELSGSCGDLGTFLPILCALGANHLVHAAPALFYAGLANLVTGVAWNLPMPVQPMKSIAATALLLSVNNSDNHSNNHTTSDSTDNTWTANTVTAAGMCMGFVLTVLGTMPGAVTTLANVVPRAVVAGMQVGVGLVLVLHGLQSWQSLPLWWNGTVDTVDCLALAVACAAVTIACLPTQQSNTTVVNTAAYHHRRRPPPIALYLFGLASILAIWKVYATQDDDNTNNSPSLDNTSSGHAWFVSTWQGMTRTEWYTGFWQGAVPQLPLTLLNSVISVCCLADTLFAVPTQHQLQNNDLHINNHVLSPRHVALSVGLLNLIACPLGAMPVCHGAGGLAGQYTFGARHGTSIVVLGLAKMVVAVAMGPVRLVHFLQALPASILGWLMAVAGHELAATGLVSLLVNTRSPTRTTRQQSTTTRDSTNFHNDQDEEDFHVDDNGSADDDDDDDPRTLFRRNVHVCLWTAVVILAFHKTHYGAAVGCGVAFLGSHHSRMTMLYRYCCAVTRTRRVPTVDTALTQEMV